MIRPSTSPLAVVIAWALLWFAGCGDVVARPIGEIAGAADATSGSDAPAFSDGSPPNDATAICQGSGPIPLPSDGGQRCTGDLARLFRFALCACQTLDASGTLSTDSFDSSNDAGPGDVDISASIGANGEVSTNATTTGSGSPPAVVVGGSVYAGGQNLHRRAAVTLGGSGTVLGDVQAAGDVEVSGSYQVAQNVDTTGNVVLEPGASLSVLGQVTLPSGDSAAGVSAVGGVHDATVSVAPPCDCANPIDVASIVAAHEQDNDDAAIGLSTGALVQPSAPVELPCGQYYATGIQGGAVTIQIAGRVALFVDGDISVDDGLVIALAQGAQLDLFVSGNVNLMGTTTFGAPNAPARVRMYVGGSSLQLAASARIGVNAYAPNAIVALASAFEMWGALFAQAFQFSGDFQIHYDTSVLMADGCAPSGGSCATCDDCAGSTPACKGGQCVPCVTTADCCAPLQCSAGSCVLTAQ